MLKRSLSIDGSPSATSVPDAVATTGDDARKVRVLNEREFSQRYFLGNSLGSGSYGQVFMASSRDSTDCSGIVALKRIDRHLGDEDEAYYAGVIDGEVAVYRALGTHANIVRLIDVFFTPEHANLVLERCDAALADRWIDARVIATDLLRGLAHMHAAHVIHLDITPANLLVTRDGRLRITDFGHSALFVDATMAARGALYVEEITTIWYRAPETALALYITEKVCARGTAPELRITAAADMWAAGCVIAQAYDAGDPTVPRGAHTPLFEQAPHNSALLSMMMCAFAPPPLGQWPHWDTAVERKTERNPPPTPSLDLREHVRDAGAHDLLGGLLRLVPATRYTAAAALDHVMFAQ